jgi:acyl-CoA synthetase (AMP-forming)/AMP-acid ligase II
MRVIDYFDRGAALYPDRPFLKSDSVTRTYRQSQLTSHAIANALEAAGLAKAAKVAAYSANDAAAFECVIGIIRSGRAWVPVNPRNPIDENAYVINSFDVEALFYHSDYEAQVGDLSHLCPKLKLLICIDRDGAYGPYLPRWIAPCEGPAPESEEHPGGAAVIFSSGGTTGRPKGVVWTNRVFETMTANYFTAMPAHQPPVHLVAAPLTHGAGAFVLMLAAVGAANILMKRADPLKIMETIEHEKVTRLYLPPTLIYMMLAHPQVRQFDYSSLEYFIYSAAPMSVERLKQAIEVFGPVLTQVYGQAEAPVMCTCLRPEDHVIGDPASERRLQSCGRPTLFTSVEIMNDDGRLLPAGNVGEVVVRGNLVMKEYYQNPTATAEVSTFGWHHTGDLGYKDDDGFVYIVDRKRDMIITGGFNVYPGEIEQVIWGHPAVQDCAVIGVPDDKWGEAVKAVIELKPSCTATESEIIAFCRGKLGGVKSPKSVEFWDSLPRSNVGKVRKKDIRAKYWEGRGRRI